MKVPVLLLAFNRPSLTIQIINAIRNYKPNKFYFSVDGPRIGNQNDKINNESVKDLVKFIDWECEVITNFSANNLGCRIGPSSGINWFFEREEMGIILEDDCLPDESFFFFCEELLEKFKDNNSISMISGTNFSFGKERFHTSYSFSIYPHIWGWASWRRAWFGYDLNMKDYPVWRNKDFLNPIFPEKRERDFWYKNFDLVAFENFSAWDYQWFFHNLKHSRLSIVPSMNLIRNIGSGDDATHTQDLGIISKLKLERMDFPLNHPVEICRNKSIEKYSRKIFGLEWKFYYPLLIFLRKILKKII
ncbi:glycosyl transferase [Leptospira levettii]|uniref:glycosyl transferase n=1 Tax=Leptospira levettii TaxID=2023178 RepID=UPI000C2A47CF|nr:glycosyl transferase [Leptospira levettii]MCW7472066.1 glycosyl transferase [Leptospira levettii]PJZ89448.1 hypothetical protein CH368_06705 [Leptospira levettii]